MDSEYPVQTTAKTFHVIEGLRELHSAGITELATHLNLSKSSVYKHIDTLQRLGYVVKVGQSYQLGFRFFELGNELREENELYRTAKSYMDNLARITGETVSLAVQESDSVVYIYSTHAGSADDDKQGTRARLATDIAGKAILAYKPTAEQEAFASNGEEMNQSLLAELRTIRDHRFAIERNSAEDHENCVAIPIRDTQDYPLGALTVCGSTASLSGKRLEEDVAGLVVSAAKSIEVALSS